MFKQLIGLLSAIALTGCSYFPTKAESEKPTQPNVLPTHTIIPGYVLKLRCINKYTLEGSTGTAFYLGDNQFISALHVVNEDESCVEAGSQYPLEIIKSDKTKDIVLLKIIADEPLSAQGMKINCEGFKKGETYLTLGYANGIVFVINKLIDTGRTTNKEFIIDEKSWPGMRELSGFLVVGMSGGPVVDLNGKVVGINNVTGYFGTKAYSFQLKDTFMCEKA